tara:strand:+ start:817 stop:966 length:150 start_codon:yes stop_codon:yes gene_type:complete
MKKNEIIKISKKLLPGFEPGIEESKSSVLTATLQELMLPGGLEPPTFGS